MNESKLKKEKKMKVMVYNSKTRKDVELKLKHSPTIETVGDQKGWERAKNFFEEYPEMIDQDDYDDGEFPEIAYNSDEKMKITLNSFCSSDRWIDKKFIEEIR